MTTTENLSSQPGAPKPLQAAINYVNDGWLPMNPALLSEIKRKFKAGEYKTDYAILLQDIKSDVSLFGYCLRELCKILDSSNQNATLNPLAMLERAGMQRLAAMINEIEYSKSRHYLSTASKLNAERLSECMTSACTAEVLARAQSVDGDLAFSCAIFRQLGLTLIAWNYPHVYQRVMEVNPSKFDLELSLSRMLGFSPTSLGLACARNWNLPKVVLEAMGDKNVKAEELASGNSESLGGTLEKICQIGELFARISSPSGKTQEPSDWSKVNNEILRNLGSKGLNIIQERIESASQYYLKTLPTLFSIPEIKDSVASAKFQQSAALFESNAYIKKLSPELQNEMRAFYEAIVPGSLGKECIEILSKRIIPLAGFSRGCIYLVDAGTTRLMPRLAVGESKISDFEEIDYTSNSKRRHFVVEAYRSTAAVMQHKLTLFGFRIRSIASSVGAMQKAGVLFLEPSTQLMEDTQKDPLIIYKAILSALNDCLGLT